MSSYLSHNNASNLMVKLIVESKISLNDDNGIAFLTASQYGRKRLLRCFLSHQINLFQLNFDIPLIDKAITWCETEEMKNFLKKLKLKYQ